MAFFNTSPGMNLPIPVVGLAPGPDWATYLDNCLSILDQHTHAPGSGNTITPDGLNISGDLSFKSNNAVLLRSSRYVAQPTTIAGSLDTGCVYVAGIDLYYNDANGNAIRITQSGGIAGSPGSIANLTSPASASYAAGQQTFVWQSGANLPANLDAGSVIVRNLTTGSNGITISPPNALAANYTLTLPSSPPAATKIVVMDSAGNLSPVYDTDNTTLEVSSNLLRLKDLGITTAKIADGQITSNKIAAAAVSGPQIQIQTITDSNVAIGAISQSRFAPPATSVGFYSGGSITTSPGSYTTITTSTVFGAISGRPFSVFLTGGTSTSVWNVSNDLKVRVANSFGSTRELLIPSGARLPISQAVYQTSSVTGTETITISVDTSGFTISVPSIVVFIYQG